FGRRETSKTKTPVMINADAAYRTRNATPAINPAAPTRRRLGGCAATTSSRTRTKTSSTTQNSGSDQASSATFSTAGDNATATVAASTSRGDVTWRRSSAHESSTIAANDPTFTSRAAVVSERPMTCPAASSAGYPGANVVFACPVRSTEP